MVKMEKKKFDEIYFRFLTKIFIFNKFFDFLQQFGHKAKI